MTFVKDPQAKLDYQVDWTAWLGSDTIKTSTWTVPTGITKVSDSATTAKATVWLSGGTDGAEYRIVNHILTNAAREDDRSFLISVKNQ